MWNDMRSHPRPSTPGERPVWVAGPSNGEPQFNGRNSPLQGEFLRQGSIRSVEVKRSKSVHDRAKEEKKTLEKERKSEAKGKGKSNATATANSGGATTAPNASSGVQRSATTKTYRTGKSSKTVVGSIKNSGTWWQRQGWRYGDGYWERKPKDKKGKAKKKEEQVQLDEHGRPIETSGWYSDSD